MTWLFENAGGRKFLLGVLGIVAVTILASEGRIDSTQAVDAIQWLIGIAAGSIALEDGLRSILGRKEPDGVGPSTGS